MLTVIAEVWITGSGNKLVITSYFLFLYYLFMAVVGLVCCAGFFSSCGAQASLLWSTGFRARGLQ